jgi:hypothetical protein
MANPLIEVYVEYCISHDKKPNPLLKKILCNESVSIETLLVSYKNFLEGSQDTLQQLRDVWDTKIKGKGDVCDVCGRSGKLQHRRIYKAVAVALHKIYVQQCIYLDRDPESEGWVYIRNTETNTGVEHIKTGTNDYSKLKFWGILEPKPNDDKSKKDSGSWRVTPKGVRFIHNKIAVPRYIWVYNDRVYDKSDDDLIYFRDCFNDHFDYEEYMNTSYNKL